jgi:hypothetical protein
MYSYNPYWEIPVLESGFQKIRLVHQFFKIKCVLIYFSTWLHNFDYWYDIQFIYHQNQTFIIIRFVEMVFDYCLPDLSATLFAIFWRLCLSFSRGSNRYIFPIFQSRKNAEGRQNFKMGSNTYRCQIIMFKFQENPTSTRFRIWSQIQMTKSRGQRIFSNHLYKSNNYKSLYMNKLNVIPIVEITYPCGEIN